MAAMAAGIIERYAAYLPVSATTPRVTLGEGSTPLIRSSRIGPSLGLDQLYVKYEGLNPSGSFKDRGMAVATAKALEGKARTLLCASTGNTSASAAAYAARCGLRAVVVVPAGGVAAGKLAQALAYGATILTVNGSFDRGPRRVWRRDRDRYRRGDHGRPSPPVARRRPPGRARLSGERGATDQECQRGAPARVHRLRAYRPRLERPAGPDPRASASAAGTPDAVEPTAGDWLGLDSVEEVINRPDVGIALLDEGQV